MLSKINEIKGRYNGYPAPFGGKYMDFKIILPGACNAKCEFCFGNNNKLIHSEWLTFLDNHLKSATPEFKELNLTGGEPTISLYFPETLKIIGKYRDKFTKVVLNTNGSKLDDNWRLLDGVVDHINISRHHYNNDVNYEIFNCKDVPHSTWLSYLIGQCNSIGIDVTLSAMLTPNLSTPDDIIEMIKFCKHVSATYLTLRQDYRLGINSSDVEKEFALIKPIYEDSCLVCRSKWQLINGMQVAWKSAVFEPSDILQDEIHEIILQPSGELTLDYAGNKQFSF